MEVGKGRVGPFGQQNTIGGVVIGQLKQTAPNK